MNNKLETPTIDYSIDTQMVNDELKDSKFEGLRDVISHVKYITYDEWVDNINKAYNEASTEYPVHYISLLNDNINNKFYFDSNY